MNRCATSGASIHKMSFIHRYDSAILIGLSELRQKGSITIRWNRFLDLYNELYPNLESRGYIAGFSTKNNSPSSEKYPSEYEMQIPEYINTKLLQHICMRLKNQKAIDYQNHLLFDVIPFFEQYAPYGTISSNSISKTSVDLNTELEINKQLTYACNNISNPYSGISYIRMREENINLYISGISNLTAQLGNRNSDQEIKNLAISGLDIFSKANYNMSIYSLCLEMKVCNDKLPKNVRNLDMTSIVMDCVYNNDILYKSFIQCLIDIHNDCITSIIEKSNTSSDPNGNKFTGTVEIYDPDYPTLAQKIIITGDDNNTICVFGKDIKELDLVKELVRGYLITKDYERKSTLSHKKFTDYYFTTDMFGKKNQVIKFFNYNLHKLKQVVSFEIPAEYTIPDIMKR